MSGELGRPDLIVLPGSKTTMADLAWIREHDLDALIVNLRREGVPVMGICGGYQMLGTVLLDPDGVESSRPSMPGVGLLPVSTAFGREKATHQVSARVVAETGVLRECREVLVSGYEIHMGETRSDVPGGPFRIVTRSGRAADMFDGAMDAEGKTIGTYIHGLFHNRGFRRSLLDYLAGSKGVGLPAPADEVDPDLEYDKLAELVRKHLDMELIRRITGLAR